MTTIDRVEDPGTLDEDDGVIAVERGGAIDSQLGHRWDKAALRRKRLPGIDGLEPDVDVMGADLLAELALEDGAAGAQEQDDGTRVALGIELLEKLFEFAVRRIDAGGGDFRFFRIKDDVVAFDVDEDGILPEKQRTCRTGQSGEEEQQPKDFIHAVHRHLWRRSSKMPRARGGGAAGRA